MPDDLENMYQYDTERKQYRRKSEGARAQKKEKSGDATGDIYSIGSQHQKTEYMEGRFERPQHADHVRKFFWITMLIVLCGWLYFVMYMRPEIARKSAINSKPLPEILGLEK